ncbi:IS3 family transposase [Micromonospora sp. KLBMP9576]|uniref:IS3 family transposase n=1 Tax=Micromonospora sp. KLBMP9576 TaxID=3424769 RepID=UPI003D940357
MPRPKKSYSPEFREEAVKLVIETSRPITQVAKEIGVQEGTLGSWVARYRRDHVSDEPELTINERARLRQLERETRELRMENEFLKKSSRVLRQGSSVSDTFEFIDAEYATAKTVRLPEAPSIVLMCLWLHVSRSGFYEWRGRPESATVRRRGSLKRSVTMSFEESDGTYGYRRVHADLAAQGIAGGPELVRSIMRELGLQPCQPRPWRHCLTESDSQADPIPDLVNRDFTADAPGQKMVGDITYISTWQGWLYLATVIDCHTKAVIGWTMDDNYKTPLIEAAIAMAARNQSLAVDAIFHTDRGSNYTSRTFAKTLNKFGIRHSVGRTGICYDNAMAESFFAALKNERVHRTQYPTREHARRDIARYIELRYNSRRRHSGIGYRIPNQVHAEYLNTQFAA